MKILLQIEIVQWIISLVKLLNKIGNRLTSSVKNLSLDLLTR